MQGLIADIDLLEEEKNQPESCEFKTTEDDDGKALRKLYIESYGCQMNFSDSEIVTSILKKEGFGTTSSPEHADVILINTCSIREKAEQTVRNRLNFFNGVNQKHADGNGNGHVGFGDLIPIFQNYGMTHNKGDQNGSAEERGLGRHLHPAGGHLVTSVHSGGSLGIDPGRSSSLDRRRCRGRIRYRK